MTRKTMLAALVLAAAGTAQAQETQAVQNGDFTETVEYSKDKYKVETNRFWSNWFVSVAGGAQVYFGDHDNRASFGDRLAPALDVNIGKWFTPGIGVRFGYNGLSLKGATKWDSDPNYPSAHGTGDPVDGGGAPHYLQKSKFNYYNLHLDAMFNLSNLLCGYNEKRVYNITAYGGLGVMKVTDEPKQTEIAGHFGLLNSFRLCSTLDLNLDLRGTLVSDRFDGEDGGRGGEGLFAATIGLTYKFKQRGWDRGKTVVRYDNAAVNQLRAQLAEANAENERLRQALAEGNRDQAKTIVKKMAAANLVTFQIGKSKLSNEARANLGLLAEVIKEADPNAVYTITGYADAGTGSKKINERLSKERAQAVYDCLVKEFGVSEKQLRMEYKGGVDNMFYDDPRLSRAVITRSN